VGINLWAAHPQNVEFYMQSGNHLSWYWNAGNLQTGFNTLQWPLQDKNGNVFEADTVRFLAGDKQFVCFVFPANSPVTGIDLGEALYTPGGSVRFDILATSSNTTTVACFPYRDEVIQSNVLQEGRNGILYGPFDDDDQNKELFPLRIMVSYNGLTDQYELRESDFNLPEYLPYSEQSFKFSTSQGSITSNVYQEAKALEIRGLVPLGETYMGEVSLINANNEILRTVAFEPLQNSAKDQQDYIEAAMPLNDLDPGMYTLSPTLWNASGTAIPTEGWAFELIAGNDPNYVVISRFYKVSGQFMLTFQGRSGQTYRIEQTDNLITPNWVKTLSITSSNSTTAVQFPISDKNQSFIRIRTE
jgi:hypothetical protein